jgi:hypothetical protein
MPTTPRLSLGDRVELSRNSALPDQQDPSLLRAVSARRPGRSGHLQAVLFPVLSQKQIQGMEIPLPYLYLSGDAKDLVDERDLSCHIIPSDILDLSFADHRHRFIAFEGTSSRIEGTEA